MEAVFAAMGSVIPDTVRLKPAEPFFAIFALGTYASM